MPTSMSSITVAYSTAPYLMTRLNNLLENGGSKDEFYAIAIHDEWTVDLFVDWYFGQPAGALFQHVTTSHQHGFYAWSHHNRDALRNWLEVHPDLSPREAALKTYFFMRIRALLRNEDVANHQGKGVLEDLMHTIWQETGNGAKEEDLTEYSGL